MRKPVNVLSQFYSDDTIPFANQDVVNYVAEMSGIDGSRVPAMLRPVPSNQDVVRNGFVGLGAVQGAREVGNNGFIVSNGILWKVSFSSPDGANFVADYVAVTGDVFGRDKVSMEYLLQGDEYLISIYTLNDGYVFNVKTGVNTKIEGFQGSNTCNFLDSFMIGTTTNGQYWFTSDVDDPYTFIVFDTYTQESDPDKITGIGVVRREAWVFGERTIEVFSNQGSTRFNRTTVINRGCLNGNTIVVAQGIPFWLGDDGSVYMGNGYNPQRISTYPIEQEITKSTLSTATAHFWESNGHTVYVLTFADGYSFMYDLSTGLWTRRETFGYTNSTTHSVWRIGNKRVAVNRLTSAVYELKWDSFGDDDGQGELVCLRRTQYFHGEQNYGICASVELVMNTGNAPSNVDKPMVMLRYSDDGGRTWSSQRRSIVGDTGEYQQRIRFYNLGRTLNRLFEIVTNGRIRREVIAMTMDVR